MPSVLNFTHQDLHCISCCLLLSQFFAPCFCWWESAPINHCLELKPLKEKPKGHTEKQEGGLLRASKAALGIQRRRNSQLPAVRINSGCYAQKTKIPRVPEQHCIWALFHCISSAVHNRGAAPHFVLKEQDELPCSTTGAINRQWLYAGSSSLVAPAQE